MSPEEAGVFRSAFEVYRYAWTEVLPRYRHPQPQETEQWVDELKEALLDSCKQRLTWMLHASKYLFERS